MLGVGVVLVLCGILYVVMPIITLRWAQTPFPGFLLDPNLVVTGTGDGEVSWPAKQKIPPVSYPERLTTFNNIPLTSNEQFYELLRQMEFGDTAVFTFVQPSEGSAATSTNPDEPTRTLTLTLIHISQNSLWGRFWFFYLLGLLMMLIGVWTFWVRPEAEAAQVFALLTTFASLSISLLFDLVTTQYFARIWIFALSLISGLNLLLTATFPHEWSFFTKRPYLRWLVFLPGLATGIWAQFQLYDTPDPWAYLPPWRATYLVSGVGLLIVLGIMIYRGYYSPSPTVRQQGRMIFGGAIIALAPLLLFFLLGSQGPVPRWLTQSLYLTPIIIYPLTIGYAIIRYRLLDVDVVIRKGLTYTLLLMLLGGVFALVVTGLSSALGLEIAMNSPIVLTVVIVLVALVFDPLRNLLQKGVDQFIFSRPVFEDLLRSHNRELTTAVHADQVAAVLLKYVENGIPETAPHLYMPDEKLGGYVIYGNSNGTLVDAESPLVIYMRHRPEPIDLTEERAWPPEIAPYHTEIAAMNAAILVPMNNGRELLGWLTLCRKQDNSYFTRHELNYLHTLADQSLIGLERSNVIRRLEARVAELDLLSQFSQALNFTIGFDDLMELVFTNYQRLLNIDDFFIYLRNPDTQRIYTAFFVEQGERYPEREGKKQITNNPHIHQVVNTGQVLATQDGNGRLWVAAPLNVGADTLGAIQTLLPPGRMLRRRQQQLLGVFADRTAIAMDRLQTREQIEKRAKQLEILNQVTFSLASTLELEPLLEHILDKAIELLDTEAGTFMLTIEDTGELEFRVVRGPASQNLLGKRLPIGTGLAGEAAQTGRPVLQNRVKEDKRWFAEVDASTEFQSNSILTVPLRRHNNVLGVLQVINKRNGAAFDDEDQSLLIAFASQAVVALENARLLQQTDEALQDQVSQLSILHDLDRDLNTTLALDRVLTLTLDWILRICQGTAGAIVLLNEDGRPRLYTTHGYDDTFSSDDVDSDRLESGLVGEVLRTGKAYVSGNVHEETNYIPASFNTHSQMTLPIVHKQRLIGVIAVESNKFNAFDPHIVETAQRVINHASAAIANAILYQQVNAANQAKSEFVSMVSHELKTPMTSMRGYTDLLLSGMTGELTPQQRNFLETIAINIKRMSQQIQDLTDISRIEMGRLRMEFTPTSFTNVMSETLPSVKQLYEEKNTELHLELPPDLPMVMADKNRLVQVMINLLSNACKYSPPQTHVYVSLYADMVALKEDQTAKAMVVCAVKDSGYGISEADQKRLFTKFFRADDPNIRKSTGTGLGLSITKGIVELHGGKIWLESGVGQGTTFYFAVPQV